jgi:hypothetical protein
MEGAREREERYILFSFCSYFQWVSLKRNFQSEEKSFESLQTTLRPILIISNLVQLLGYLCLRRRKVEREMEVYIIQHTSSSTAEYSTG